MLLLYNFVRPYAATVLEHAGSFGRFSDHPVFALNTADDYPPALDRFQFDVVVLHYSLFGGTPYLLGDHFLRYLGETDAYTVAFFQDEYYFCRQRFDFLNRFDIDCVYTLLEQKHVPAVYGARTRVRRVESTIPGFVSDEMVEAARVHAKPIGERRVDIGYRARRLPYYMGRGAQEKHEIGVRALEFLADEGLVLDIATHESARLYHDGWYRFLGDCRAVLGVEAGVSIYDIDDVVREACQSLLAVEPDLTFAEVHDRVLAPWEGNIPYRTISPRHFEAAAFGCCQILYEGHYSDILEPWRHYLPLRKDWSNIDEVVARYRDEQDRGRIVETAHVELIASGEYGYDKFVRRFDDVLRDVGITPPAHGPWEAEIARALGRRPLGRRVVRSTRRRLGALRRRFSRST